MVASIQDEGAFKFEKCLLKHFIRKEGWLPICKERLRIINSQRPAGKEGRPRLKYFTFCAAGAVDVLMLDLEKVVRQSDTGGFDTVYFFDVDDVYVARTRESIPGAVGFPADFVNVVLAEDPNEAEIVDAVTTLEPTSEQEFTQDVRRDSRILAIRRQFVQSFPFDIINLDLERYLFRPRENLPGKLVNAFRKVFEWQRKPGLSKDGREYRIDAFSLMFTLRIGPKDLGADYRDMMSAYVESNLSEDPSLVSLFESRSGGVSPKDLLEKDFDSFFKLAVPKTILALLKEEDWHLDPEHEIKVYEFERLTTEEPYKMLHFVMSVKRNAPPRESRAPGTIPKVSQEAYQAGVIQIFKNDSILVPEALKALGEETVAKHLERIFKHRAKIVKQ